MQLNDFYVSEWGIRDVPTLSEDYPDWIQLVNNTKTLKEDGVKFRITPGIEHIH